jgi:hypothetical protein
LTGTDKKSILGARNKKGPPVHATGRPRSTLFYGKGFVMPIIISANRNCKSSQKKSRIKTRLGHIHYFEKEDGWSYTNIDIEKAKKKALASYSFGEFQMWVDIQEGRL